MILILWENMFLWQIFHVLFHKHLQTWMQLGFGVQGCQVPGGVNLWVVLLKKNLHNRKCSASFPISESDTQPLRTCPSVSLIKDNCPQTVIFTGQTTQMWHALRIFRTSFLFNSHGVVCFPFQHAGPHYLIGRYWLTANWIGCRYSSSVMTGPIWRPILIRVVEGQESIAPGADLDWSSAQEVYHSFYSVLT